MLFQQIEPSLQAGQHAERQDIDLQNAERIEIVLVPFDRRAIVHRGIGERHHLVEPRASDHEAAGMLRQVAGETGEFGGERSALAETRLGRIEARRGGPHPSLIPPDYHPPDRARQGGIMSSERPKLCPHREWRNAPIGNRRSR